MSFGSRQQWKGLAAGLVVVGLAACSGDENPVAPPPPPPTDEPEAVITGDIEGTRTLSADTTYTLRGTVVVADGGVLDIPAGTLILADATVQPTALIVRAGGQIFAQGTADAPIVFTSSRPAGQRARGDWGGLILNGRSLCNFPADQCIGEGNSGPYGGDVPDDDSGVLSYVRVEFVGYEVSFGNELNGLTLNGVGSGTRIDHIQSHFGLDDGIEWFGGTVDAKHLLVTGASDDSFDYSTGWQGRGQFWIALQDPADADNGFEVDGNEDDFDAMPLTDPLIYNVTLVGGGAAAAAGESTRGLLLRRGTGGDIYNAIVLGFGTAGLDIDNAETVGRVTVQNSIFFGNAASFEEDDDGIDEAGLAMAAGWNNRVVDPGLTAPFDFDAPDFRPETGAEALNGFATPPSDGFFEDVDFIGGVQPDGTPWYDGWTTFARN